MAELSFSSATSLTITLASLANNAARESTYQENDTSKYLDVALQVSCKLATGTPSGNQSISVYAYHTIDNTTYTDNATGSDAAITLRIPTNLTLIGILATPDSGALTYTKIIPSLSKAMGSNFATVTRWGVVVKNTTGLAFDSTGSSVKFVGIKTA